MSLNVRFHVGQMVIQNPQLTVQERHLRTVLPPLLAARRRSLIGIFRETAAACSPGWQHRSLTRLGRGGR
jgi:hypothetical protein